MSRLTGWRYGLFVAGFVGTIAAAFYPIFIHPMINIEKYKKLQEINRKGVRQEDVQPGGMKVWSDPFDRK